MFSSCPDNKPCESIAPRSLDLEEMRWNRRVLLIFAPDRTAEAYPRIASEIGRQLERIADYEIEVAYLFTRGPGRHGERPLSSHDAAHFRHRFEIDDDEVVAILLDRSGEEALRQDAETFDLDRMLNTLDETPLRQHELMDKRRAESITV